MRKEIVRSLVVWPAAASVTIIAWTWLSPPGDRVLSFQDLRGFAISQARTLLADSFARRSPEPIELPSTPVSAPIDLPVALAATDSSEVVADMPPVERAEQGARAMKLPSRLIEVFSVTASPAATERESLLIAPIRNKRHEMAGMVPRPRRDVRADLSSGQPIVADVTRHASGAASSVAASANRRVIGRKPVGEELQAIKPIASVAPAGDESLRPRTHDSSASSNRLPKVDAFAPARIPAQLAADTTRSLLPQSIQYLGKLESPGKTRRAEPTEDAASSLSMTVADIQSAAADRREIIDSPAGWPVTQALDVQLQSLAETTAGSSAANQWVSPSASAANRWVSPSSSLPPLPLPRFPGARGWACGRPRCRRCLPNSACCRVSVTPGPVS